MIAKNFYDKALSNFKIAKTVIRYSSSDEEQLNLAAYHLQQAIELTIKHILTLNNVSFSKTHDIDQLIILAKSNDIELYLPEYIIEKADSITLWETKTRYIMGFKVELDRINKTVEELDKYYKKLSEIKIL